MAICAHSTGDCHDPIRSFEWKTVKFRLSVTGGQFWILAQGGRDFLVTVKTRSHDVMNARRAAEKRRRRSEWQPDFIARRPALNLFGDSRRNLVFVPCRLSTRRIQFTCCFCCRDDRVYRCVQRLVDGRISGYPNSLRHGDITSLDFAPHGSILAESGSRSGSIRSKVSLAETVTMTVKGQFNGSPPNGAASLFRVAAIATLLRKAWERIGSAS